MPPMLSEDESDGPEVPDSIPAKAFKVDPFVDEEKVKSKDGDEDEDEDEDDADEEYEIEKIIDHKFSKKGEISYKVKWLGYEDEADQTWEPAENLVHATERLKEYNKLIGGTPEPPVSAKKAAPAKRGTKRASEDSPAPAPNKRGRKARKSEAETQGTNGVKKDFVYPDESWESYVTQVVSIVEESILPEPGRANPEDTSLHCFVKWNSGHQSKHPLRILRIKCPQKLIDYFEQHLVFSNKS